MKYNISEVINKLKIQGNKKIVFTNGVFDILHKGHVEYLNAAKNYGDVLVVGINSDRSVKEIKGPQRPINSENDRAFIIENLKSVDYVFIFDESTPIIPIQTILPDVLVKGGDYDANETNPENSKYIVGSDIVKKNKGQVVTIDLTKGKSTTNIITKIKIG